MKETVKKLLKANSPVGVLNPNIDEVMHNIIDLSVILHELTSMGINYDQIVEMVDALNTKNVNFRNAVLESITSN